ncbi:TlpA family protein disulfide reductase [Mucilaginibacter sp. HMF5004]|uniref:TlpA family protein disulfide reductase n=1 Tax=Mucilaginibacter rivuli TaxID=2857527 RepID=UPI001C5EB972|nr:TlpA disulfide reductase family protein [Mucilaginibacter rivuli]MBW4891630.1 TlpA family protein disulfide reductase [Mucilaginibacter rivuli]
MKRSYKTYIKAVLFFILLALTTDGFCYQNITIRGNVKYLGDKVKPNALCFEYDDMLSGNKVLVPVITDTKGNFDLNMQINYCQEINLSRIITYNGKAIDGVKYTSFFARPGQAMQLTCTFTATGDFTVSFKGDVATENNQYQDYLRALDKPDLRYYIPLSKQSPGADYHKVGQIVLSNYNNILNFNTGYFKTHNTNPFVKQQVTNNLIYSAAHNFINLMPPDKTTDSILLDFGKAIHLNINNPGALGNSFYKDFIHDYHSLLLKSVKGKSPYFKETEFAKYILDNGSGLTAADRDLLLKKADTTKQLNKKESDRFLNLMGRNVNDYFATLEHNLSDFDFFLQLKDTYQRDLFATITLYKLIDSRQFAYIKPNLNSYKATVKNVTFKNSFLSAYQKQDEVLNGSKLSPKSIIYIPDNLKGLELFNTIIKKYNGKAIYVDFWATWCGPCIAEMEFSKKLREQLAGENIVFLYVCLSSPNTNDWKRLIAAKNIEGENYFLDFEQSAVVSKQFSINTIPRYMIINRVGETVNHDAKKPSDSGTLNELEKLLR